AASVATHRRLDVLTLSTCSELGGDPGSLLLAPEGRQSVARGASPWDRENSKCCLHPRRGGSRSTASGAGASTRSPLRGRQDPCSCQPSRRPAAEDGGTRDGELLQSRNHRATCRRGSGQHMTDACQASSSPIPGVASPREWTCTWA